MNKLILVVYTLMFFNNLTAQDAVDLASNEICKCAKTKLQYLDNPDQDQKEIVLYKCTSEIFNSNLDEILKEYGIEIQLEGTFDRFTKDANDYLIKNCSDVLPNKLIITSDPSSKAIIPNASKEIGIVECTVLKIENYQYPTIEAKDKNGVLHRFIIYKPFSTDILFTAGGIKAGNNILVSFETEDIYDNIAKEPRTFKVVTQLEKRK